MKKTPKKISLSEAKSLGQMLKQAFDQGMIQNIQPHFVMTLNTFVHSYTVSGRFFELVCMQWRDTGKPEQYSVTVYYPNANKYIFGQAARQIYQLCKTNQH